MNKWCLIATFFLAQLLLLSGLRGDVQQDAETAWTLRHEGASGEIASTDKIMTSIQLFQKALDKEPDNLNVRWKLMRSYYFLGRYTGMDEEQQQDVFEDLIQLGNEGLERIEKIINVDPEDKPERLASALKGHDDALLVFFYQAVGWGQWALAFGKLKAVRKGAAGKIRDYATVCYLADPGMENGGPQRVLGRLHHQTPRVPFITGWASNKKARTLLEEAVTRGPENPMNYLFLGELLLESKKTRDEAENLFMKVVNMSPRKNFIIEDRDSVQLAVQHLEEMKKP